MKNKNRLGWTVATAAVLGGFSATSGCITEPNARDRWIETHSMSLEPTEVADPQNPGKMIPYADYKKRLAEQKSR